MHTFIIVPKADAENNWSMLNHSLSKTWAQVKVTSDGECYLFKVAGDEPHGVFDSYQWYTKEEIQAVLDGDSKWD
jgi:hypothetical protein